MGSSGWFWKIGWGVVGGRGSDENGVVTEGRGGKSGWVGRGELKMFGKGGLSGADWGKFAGEEGTGKFGKGSTGKGGGTESWGTLGASLSP